ncbi:hypothetical protein [Chitinophaga sp. Cy-1792]|uniref:hypothetical protein n=1 Tax=Chitinophaga sp. Cy-1792 TaxID=2608339 RepID=UPI00141EA4EF|nr:hypothetical protein [Chitinophaga sp. Cy-1792]NIG55601.1 hypothetical protein [Chitinophaga sp. Cy-1792]
MKKILTTIIFVLVLGAAFFGIRRATTKATAASTATAAPAAKAAAQFNITFVPYPPKDLSSPNASEEELISFAWNEFFALNWKSRYYTTNSNFRRGLPDTNWDYDKDAAPAPDLLVWETYAHRVELRRWNDVMNNFDTVPYYQYSKPILADPGVKTNLFNNLDENNEIGSCDVYAQVYKYYKKYQVLYQAKANRDEFNYIKDHYPTKEKLDSATSKTANNITLDSAYFKGAIGNCDLPDSAKIFCLPCGTTVGTSLEGAMEVKTAWRQLTPEEDSNRYLMRTVLTYENGPNGQAKAVNRRYALIAIHIIHKTKNYPNFVFATFEQVDVDSSYMGYVELDKKGHETDNFHKNYPRQHPIAAITAASTVYVHQELKKRNPRSIWQYYRLVGVQGQPDTTVSSANFFLANYVVESDSVLASFHGSSIGHPFDKKSNILHNNKFLSIGGCQGCHGAAQVNLGTDGSFLCDTVDKPVRMPDPLNYGNAKLSNYIHTFQAYDRVHTLLLEKQKQQK